MGVKELAATVLAVLILWVTGCAAPERVGFVTAGAASRFVAGDAEYQLERARACDRGDLAEYRERRGRAMAGLLGACLFSTEALCTVAREVAPALLEHDARADAELEAGSCR